MGGMLQNVSRSLLAIVVRTRQSASTVGQGGRLLVRTLHRRPAQSKGDS